VPVDRLDNDNTRKQQLTRLAVHVQYLFHVQRSFRPQLPAMFPGYSPRSSSDSPNLM